MPPQLSESTDASRYSNGTMESPELLRWRADLLLDEMLLGGADVGAGHNGANGAYSNGVHDYSANGSSAGKAQPLATNGYHPEPQHSSGYASSSPVEENRGNYQTFSKDTPVTASPVTNNSPTPQPLLVSAEQRYNRSVQSLPPVIPTADAATQNSTETMQNSANQEPQASSGLGPVRRNQPASSSNAGTMSVASRGSKYSTLLPRESNVEPELLQREIASLGTQLASEMPANHESRERAQKLLDKANTILQSDPMRSAEVDYYLQQVRSMIERLRQSLGYSALYERRLRTYLLSWLTLALVVIVGCFLYGQEFVDLASAIANWGSNTIGAQHLIAFILTLFAGGLGGTLCAIWSVRTQPYRESGFLDRKFSLRSMILPISGFVAGIFIYLLLGLVYWGLGLDPSHNLWITLFPMLLACLLAAGQNLLFGVRV